VALAEARACRRCASELPLGPRPILQIGAGARLLIASQAPGRIAHRSGIPFADRSGELLRLWLGLEPAIFYDPARVAILPQGLCYPGRGPGGDRPPRPDDGLRQGRPPGQGAGGPGGAIELAEQPRALTPESQSGVL